MYTHARKRKREKEEKITQRLTHNVEVSGWERMGGVGWRKKKGGGWGGMKIVLSESAAWPAGYGLAWRG